MTDTTTSPVPPSPVHSPVRSPVERHALTVPTGWLSRGGSPDDLPGGMPGGTIVASRAPRLSVSGVPTELTLVVVGDPDPPDLRGRRDRAMAELALRLPGFDLEDAEEYEIDSGPVAYRRFGHRLGTAAVVSEQWAWLVAGGPGATGGAEGLGVREVVLTCSCAAESYVTWCDLFEALADGVDPQAAVAQAEGSG